MTEANYSYRTVERILKNLLELKQGLPPDPIPGELLPLSKHAKGHHAAFEIWAGMAGIIEARLAKCGYDGVMTRVYYVLGESDDVLSRIAGCSARAVPWRIRRVIGYISGKPKNRSYWEYRDRKKGVSL